MVIIDQLSILNSIKINKYINDVYIASLIKEQILYKYLIIIMYKMYYIQYNRKKINSK